MDFEKYCLRMAKDRPDLCKPFAELIYMLSGFCWVVESQKLMEFLITENMNRKSGNGMGQKDEH